MSRMSIGGPCGTVAALCAALFMPVVSAKIALDAPSDYTTGQYLHYAITADLNQDGKPDLIVAANGHLTVLLGTGQTFQNPLNGTTGTYHTLAAADFNGDGKTDLATEQGTLLGNGDGTFQPIVPLPASSYLAVSSADVNGDGKQDLVYGAGSSGGFQVFTGNGDGTFVSRYTAANPVSQYSALALFDYNGDGKKDLAFVGTEGYPWLALGNGNGTFQPRVNLGGTGYLSLAAADLNGDAKTDLVISGNSGVHVRLGNGNGSFQSPTLLPAGGYYNTLVRDLNSDGKLDIYVGNTYFLGLGNGTFSAPVPILNELTTPPSYWLGPHVDGADFNGDGWVDFTAYRPDVNTNAVTVFFSKGGGQYRQLPIAAFSPQQPMAMATGDFDRDGKLDVVTLGSAGLISVFLGNQDGTFQQGGGYHSMVTEFVTSLRTGDFNKDGIVDLIVGGNQSGGHPYVQVFLGTGIGTFTTGPSYALSAQIAALTSGDFNADGKVDIVSSGGDILLGNGTGGFTYGSPVNLTSINTPNFISSADFNRDGKLDLAFLDPYQGVVVMLGMGNAAFGSPLILAAGSQPQCLTVADLNKDSNIDIVVADRSTNNAYTFLGKGDGTFLAAKLSGGFGVASRLVATDLDGDGNLDLVGANGSVQDITVLPGRGDGTFLSALRYFSGAYHRSVLPGEVTGDGKIDLIVAAFNQAFYIDVFKNISQ